MFSVFILPQYPEVHYRLAVYRDDLAAVRPAGGKPARPASPLHPLPGAVRQSAAAPPPKKPGPVRLVGDYGAFCVPLRHPGANRTRFFGAPPASANESCPCIAFRPANRAFCSNDCDASHTAKLHWLTYPCIDESRLPSQSPLTRPDDILLDGRS